LVAICLGVVPIALYFKGQQQKHEQEHLERMKALEWGLTLPVQDRDHTRSMAARIALLIGAGVPIGVFGCAWLASLAVGYHEPIWIAAAMVGLGGVICGTVLAGTMFASARSDSTSQPSNSLGVAKSFVEEDAYDVVSARG
jgi:hypothetical protein